MAKRFGAAAQELEAVIAGAEAAIAFITASGNLRPRIGGMLDWPNLGDDGKAYFRAFVSVKDFDPEAVFSGLIVVIHGALERFLRRITAEMVQYLDQSCQNYNELNDAVGMANRYFTGRMLTRIKSPPAHVSVDFDELCRRIGTCVRGASEFRLNPDAFAFEIRDVSMEATESFWNGMGVTVDWDEVCKAGKLDQVFETSGPREAQLRLKNWLKEFAKRRNGIAPNGDVPELIDEEFMSTAIGATRGFASGLASAKAIRLK